MQDTYQKIFEMAKRDCPDKIYYLPEETVIFYGFRISKKADGYDWKDGRYNDYFEPVDPIITEKILELGFKECIIQVVQHTDQERVTKLQRNLMEIEAEVNHWTSEASKAHNRMKKDVSGAKGDKEKIAEITRRFEANKKRFSKKRGVLRMEKEALLADIKFYQSRIKLHQTLKTESSWD